ncbi:MAG: hypothetical protein JW940_36015 [Polyangiaceae bacterium]|nr:hypothetical protein [Polyangiaceae bacterium]
MTVITTLFEHQGFGGAANTFSAGRGTRYRGVRLGGLANEVTSFRASATEGSDGNVYGFTHRDFDGRFACLNVPEGWTSWYSDVGPLNDDIESALLVNRDKEETSLDPVFWLADAFATQLDAMLAGQPVRRDGDPVISGVFFPAYDPERVFLRIQQNLVVEVDVGSQAEVLGVQVLPSDLIIDDYHSSIAYDIFLDLASLRRLRAEVHWVTTWVEGGMFTDQVFEQLHAQATGAVGTLNQALAALGDLSEAIAIIRRRFFGQPYVLPGSLPNMPPPSSNFGVIGDSNEGATIVLPLRSFLSDVADLAAVPAALGRGP